ncbi:hypothetical protein JHK85_006212 [Glycine max]|nr:hypothetical protein JHK85_006212 [Glycine max]
MQSLCSAKTNKYTYEKTLNATVPATTANSSQRKPKRKRASARSDPELDRLDALPWNSALPPQNDDDDDAFSLFSFARGVNKRKTKKKKSEQNENLKKQQQDGIDGACSNAVVEAELDESVKSKEKKKKKNKTTNKKKDATVDQTVEQSDAGLDTNVKDDGGEEDVDETECYAWNELRLHPLLMKAICKLGFKEPTPIQKACIPAAAHQGKDVVGAAETGSGKTLAFGLPILQRLLEEREKAANMDEERGEEPEKYAPTGFLRALIIAPTRELALQSKHNGLALRTLAVTGGRFQVTDHLKAVAKHINVRVIPIVGGILAEKQERLLIAKPDIVVGTPGRLWELMSAGEKHLVELHSLSFFVLDEADRMVQNGHFKDYQRKKRQTLVFSATVALSSDFRKKLKRGSIQQKQSLTDGLNSIETLSERAGMRPNAAIIDLTNPSILAAKLEESFIECREEDKDAYLYYILTVHGQGRTIVFCTSIAALRHISSISWRQCLDSSCPNAAACTFEDVYLCKLHAINGLGMCGGWGICLSMQTSCNKRSGHVRGVGDAMDRFRENENGILVATDVAARGLDIPGVRTVVHYQLPHSAEVYVHRSGRTARASAEGCSIALISSRDTSKFASLCKSFSNDNFQRFPLENSYVPEVLKRLSLARQIDKITRKESQEKAEKNWFDRNASSVELVTENYDSEEEQVNKHKQMKISSRQLKKLQEAGVTPLMQEQLQQLARQKLSDHQGSGLGKKGKLVVIGQDCVDALQALRSAGEEVRMDVKDLAGKQRNMQNLKRKRKEEKKRLRDQRRKQKKKLKYGNE